MTTVTPLPADLRDPMRKTMNKCLMVRFINADLLNRASLDVRKSVVLYDDSGLFEYALETMPDDALLQRLYNQTKVRYFSKGI